MKIVYKNTKGAYNVNGYLANDIRYDESRVIAKSENLNEAIDWEIENRDKFGVIIVFSTDVNAVELSDNKIVNWVKQKVATLKNRIAYNKKIDKIANSKEDVYAWTVGRFLHGRYKAKDGRVFDENSISVEFLNISTDTLISIAEEICREFLQESVLVKCYEDNRIVFVNRD